MGRLLKLGSGTADIRITKLGHIIRATRLDKLRMDLMYSLRPSILADLRIMMATVKSFFMTESTTIVCGLLSDGGHIEGRDYYN